MLVFLPTVRRVFFHLRTWHFARNNNYVATDNGIFVAFRPPPAYEWRFYLMNRATQLAGHFDEWSYRLFRPVFLRWYPWRFDKGSLIFT